MSLSEYLDQIDHTSNISLTELSNICREVLSSEPRDANDLSEVKNYADLLAIAEVAISAYEYPRGEISQLSKLGTCQLAESTIRRFYTNPTEGISKLVPQQYVQPIVNIARDNNRSTLRTSILSSRLDRAPNTITDSDYFL